MRSFAFPATIFLGAFLLFQMQPILGRFVLPWFGGSPSVWTTCLLFFQGALLAGYLYAHWLGSRPNLRGQGYVHVALLALSIATLPIIPSPSLWKPSAGQDPSLRILLMLAATAGVPYFALSATAPLLQRWFTLLHRKRTPWRLYSLSNLGSFLALLTYPVIIEPSLKLRTQAYVWSALYACFIALCATLAWSMRGALPVEEHTSTSDDEPPGPWTIVYWLVLSVTGATLLMATTSEISQEIAVSPFLWVAPLAVYLLSFVLTFEGRQWYRRRLFAVLTGVLAPAACVVATIANGVSIWIQLGVYLSALFAACMVCHGELVWAKPSPRHLTTFYLCVAGGGVLGGIFAAIFAPRNFKQFTEFPVAFAAACALGFAGWLRSGAYSEWARGNIGLRLALMALMLGSVSSAMTISGNRAVLASVRNFYGILRVSEQRVSEQSGVNGTLRQLTHGSTKHGFQYQAAERRAWPTSYYGPHSGAGLVLNALSKPERRIAVVGLGAGTMAAWGRPGDTIRFYEINPAVETLARQWFTFLEDSKAHIEVAIGDARIELERELASGQRHDFDVIAVDAFSSDSIPIHLLTSEFADLCRERLASGGLLLFHISNRTLDLEPVVRGLALHLGWRGGLFINPDEPKLGEDAARWVLIAENASFFAQEHIAHAAMVWTADGRSESRDSILWTDDFASLWHVFRF